MAATVRGPAVLVEYGASEETKAEYLLREGDGAPVFRAYVPIDVAAPQLEQMRARLRQRRPDLLVCVVPADFMDVAALPTAGSVVAAAWFLSRIDDRQSRSTGGATFPASARVARWGASRGSWWASICARTPPILLPAYDDAQGVTAAFNRNLLVRLNREAGADFDLDAFAHRAEWNDDASRIEMHLVSLREQVVRVAGEAIRFARGETIHTENSYKYAPERFAELAEAGRMAQRGTVDRSGAVVLIASAGAAARAVAATGGCWRFHDSMAVAGDARTMPLLTPRPPSARRRERRATAGARDARGSSMCRSRSR